MSDIPFESQRDFVPQPKVARHALPWVWREEDSQPQRGCVHARVALCHNPVGVDHAFDACSQGIASLNPGLDDIAPLGQTECPSLPRL